MATYPEDPKPSHPFIINPRFNNIISEFDSGKEQRRAKWTFPVFDVQLTYKKLSKTEAQTIYDFFMARKGSYEAFYIYDMSLLESISLNQDGLYVGTGDGSGQIFDIPGRSTNSHTVYIDGVAQSAPGDYSILTGGGESSSDRIEFTSAPSAGEVITVDFTGYLRMRVRFAEDTLSMTQFLRNYYHVNTIKLTGLKCEDTGGIAHSASASPSVSPSSSPSASSTPSVSPSASPSSTPSVSPSASPS